MSIKANYLMFTLKFMILVAIGLGLAVGKACVIDHRTFIIPKLKRESKATHFSIYFAFNNVCTIVPNPV